MKLPKFRSDEGLTLETSAFQIFHGGNFTFINSFDKTKFLLLTSDGNLNIAFSFAYFLFQDGCIILWDARAPKIATKLTGKSI